MQQIEKPLLLTFTWAKEALKNWRLDHPDSPVTWEHVEEFCIARIRWQQSVENTPDSAGLLISARAAAHFARMEYYSARLPYRLMRTLTTGIWGEDDHD